MSKSLKNYTTIRSVLSEKEWTARSLRICFLLMPWQDGIEVTDELMKAVVGWEGKLNNFFLKSLDITKHSSPQTASQEASNADSQLLNSLEKAKAAVDTALCDSFNTSAVMRILSDLVTEANSAEALSGQTVLSIARWITRIVTIFGLDPEGDLGDAERIGWSGLDIPTEAKPYIYPASQLRDEVRTLACSGSVDHTAIGKLADEITTESSTPAAEAGSGLYDQVLQQFRTEVKTLAAQNAPAKDLLALCDQLRDTHLWNLGIYLEDRTSPRPALVRPLDKLLVQAREERESVISEKANAKLEWEAKEVEAERELRELAKVDPLVMFRMSDEFSEWDENGIPTVDAAGNAVSKSRRKKLVKEWEKQRKRHKEWVVTKQDAERNYPVET